MRLAVRRARPDELDLVHEIMRAAFAEYEGVLPVASGANSESVSDVRRAVARGGAVLAFHDGQPVGSARFELVPDAVYVGRVSVLPAHRRRGVASAMMRFLEDLAPSLGRGTLRVAVRESLPSNIELYRSLGYEVLSIDAHARGPDRVWTMVKRIAPIQA